MRIETATVRALSLAFADAAGCRDEARQNVGSRETPTRTRCLVRRAPRARSPVVCALTRLAFVRLSCCGACDDDGGGGGGVAGGGDGAARRAATASLVIQRAPSAMATLAQRALAAAAKAAAAPATAAATSATSGGVARGVGFGAFGGAHGGVGARAHRARARVVGGARDVCDRGNRAARRDARRQRRCCGRCVWARAGPRAVSAPRRRGRGAFRWLTRRAATRRSGRRGSKRADERDNRRSERVSETRCVMRAASALCRAPATRRVDDFARNSAGGAVSATRAGRKVASASASPDSSSASDAAAAAGALCVCARAFLTLATGRAIQPRARRQPSRRPVRCRSRRRRVRSLTDCVRILQTTVN
ncbi:MAG: hypothetical protein IPK60_20620 [Sandaracinaceae bacterium]|nr:hypothetical protein [Sandaracinaceae bacterium]